MSCLPYTPRMAQTRWEGIMKAFTRTIWISRPPDAVVDFFVDFDRGPEWRSYVKAMRHAGDDACGGEAGECLWMAQPAAHLAASQSVPRSAAEVEADHGVGSGRDAVTSAPEEEHPEILQPDEDADDGREHDPVP